MTERVDHTALAKQLLEVNETVRGIDAIATAAEAQAHATLALVEQQRIANLISLMQMQMECDENTEHLAGEAMHALIEYERSAATQFSDPDDYPVVRAEIKEALGL